MGFFSSTPFGEAKYPILRDGRLGLLYNQAAWHTQTGEYLFKTLYRRGNLKRVFIPEHGLFGEIQEQVKLDDTGSYAGLGFSFLLGKYEVGNERTAIEVLTGDPVILDYLEGRA